MSKTKKQPKILSDSAPLFLPVTVCFALVAIARTAIACVPQKIGGYMGISVLILIIFLAPSYIGLKMKQSETKVSSAEKLYLHMIKPEHIFLMLFGALFIMSGSILLDILFRGIPSSSSFTLYGTFTATGDGSEQMDLFLAVTFAAIPAICEETLFRGALISKNTALSSILTCSLLYALLSFDPTLFPSSFLTGLLLSFILMITDSLPACITVHFLLNIFGIFARTNISSYYMSSADNPSLIIVLLLVLLVSGALFFAEAARNFELRARSGRQDIILKKEKAVEVLKNTFSVFLSPLGILCIILYAAIYALNLIFG